MLIASKPATTAVISSAFTSTPPICMTILLVALAAVLLPSPRATVKVYV
jgi:hypothetical protein